MVTRADMRRRILDDLADEGVDVELSDRQTDNCIRRALELYTKHNPVRQWFNLGIVGPTKTAIISFPNTGMAGIVDVVFDDIDPQTRPYVMPSTYEMRWGIRGPRLFFELHVAERRMERFAGESPDWYWEPTLKVLYVYTPTRAVKVMGLILKDMTLEDIKSYQEDDFEKLCVGHAKFLLARILGKYGSIPGAQGDITTDAEHLRAESKEEINEIRERMERSLKAVPPPRYIG